MKQTVSALAVALTLACSTHVFAQSRFELINQDPAGAGLNDPTPVDPIGGNPGRTLGEQRLIAQRYAMDLWGALLSSSQPIRVQASFSPLECESDGNVLAKAGAISWRRNFPNAPSPGLDYPVAMANALADEDLAPGSDDIQTFFNSDLATPRCNGIEWFYGLKGNGDNSENSSNFLNVIMHEIGHGLGVQGPTGSGYAEIARSNQFDSTVNALSATQRSTALTTVGDVVWTGRRTNASTQLIADNRRVLVVDAPSSTAGRYEFGLAAFGEADAAAIPAGVVVRVLDAGAETSLACEGGEIDGAPAPAIANPEAIAGRIALIDRGGCEFGLKAANAQQHGAVAVIIANTQDAVFGGMGPGEHGAGVTVPVVSVSRSTGQRLRGDDAVRIAGAQVEPDRYYGLDDAGRTRLYVNTTIEPGSTFSHVDADMSPNALMEPRETKTLDSHIFVDVSLDLYEDLGWPVNRNGTAILGGCDTGIPVIRDVGFIPGANLMAQQNVCEVASRGSRAGYQRCMNDHALELRDADQISNAEVLKVRQCLASSSRSSGG